jgi:pyridoxamine 5'-phosphate oxidase
MNLADLRKDYTLKELSEFQVLKNPFEQFQSWMDEAIKSEVLEPTAMHLSTVSVQGRPSGRIVLLKGIENQGFVFYTNYESHKGKELAQNPYACLTFFWAELERQVRIEGTVLKVSAENSDAYFNIRPRGSRIGAWASPQSQVISDRKILENNVLSLENQYKEQENIPRPIHWGGYSLKPDLFEFWQGRPSRLHDRIQFSLENNQDWKIKRLAP